MTFTRKQIKIAYEKLSPEIKDFIMDSDTDELIENLLNYFGLSEEKLDLANVEILFTMYGLQSLADTISNISKISGKSIGELSELRNNLEENIFAEMERIKNTSSDGTSQKPINDIKAKEKIEEISLKYGLSEAQKDILIELGLSVIFSPEEKNNLEERIQQSLSISKLLAVQIMNDLNSRVFNYSVKDAPKEVSQQKSQAVDTPLSRAVSDIEKEFGEEKERIEKKQDTNGLNFLRSMSGDLKNLENPETTSSKIKAPQQESNTSNRETQSIYENEIPNNLPGVVIEKNNTPLEKGFEQKQEYKNEFVQRPISVPRYNADLGEEDKGEYLLKKAGIFPEHTDDENKPIGLKPDLSYKKETPKDFPPVSSQTNENLNVQEKPTKSYVVDPYREPFN